MANRVNVRFVSPDHCRKARYVGGLSWVCECAGACQPKRNGTVNPRPAGARK